MFDNNMARQITSSKTALFTGGQLLLIHFSAFILGQVSGIKSLGILAIVIWPVMLIKKKKIVDIENRTFKDGPLKKSIRLEQGGYLSLVRKLKKSTKEVDKDGLQLMYVQNEEPIHIYSSNTYNDLKETGELLADEWSCDLYEVHSKQWLMRG